MNENPLVLFLTAYNLTKSNEDLPKISIVVAARNEEKNIAQLLNLLSTQNYLNDRYERLIGFTKELSKELF